MIIKRVSKNLVKPVALELPDNGKSAAYDSVEGEDLTEFRNILTQALKDIEETYPWICSLPKIEERGVVHVVSDLNRVVEHLPQLAPFLFKDDNHSFYPFYLSDKFSLNAQYQVIYCCKSNSDVKIYFPATDEFVTFKERGILLYPNTHMYTPVLAVEKDSAPLKDPIVKFMTCLLFAQDSN